MSELLVEDPLGEGPRLGTVAAVLKVHITSMTIISTVAKLSIKILTKTVFVLMEKLALYTCCADLPSGQETFIF